MRLIPATLLAMSTLLLPAAPLRAETFSELVAFMRQHTDIRVIKSEDGLAQAAIAPAYQGRLMVSTASGADGRSHGWINRPVIASGEPQKHIHVFGGAERFWLGPEGGQFSIYFPPGAPFEFEHWQTPAAIDTMSYDVVGEAPGALAFRKEFSLRNYSNVKLDVRVDRILRLLDRARVSELLGVELPGDVRMVAVESENRLTNAGTQPWTRQTGALSVWILCMLNPSPETTLVIPFQQGPESELGPVVNDDYFGKVPPTRLKVGDGVLFFSGDGRERGKIGLSPKRALPVAGSYDAANGVLTIVHFNKPEDVLDYVNSAWRMQDDPFSGDTVNAYNDGPPGPGLPPLGPFYELETSSPAAFLAPEETLTHYHRTIHLEGPEASLDAIARSVLRAGLDEIRSALK